MEDGLDDSGVLRYVGDGGRWSSMVLMVDGDEEESRDGSLSPETLQLFFYLDVDLLSHHLDRPERRDTVRRQPSWSQK